MPPHDAPADRYRAQLYPYRYFVSYAYAGGFGHIAIDRTHPVLDMHDVQAMAEQTKRDTGYPKVTIVSFQRFPDN